MGNERGFYWIEILVILSSAGLLFLTAIHLYGSISTGLGQIQQDWELFWEMKKWVFAWKQGMLPEGHYSFDEYELFVQERSFIPNIKEGELKFTWDFMDIPKERKLYVYKMDMP